MLLWRLRLRPSSPKMQAARRPCSPAVDPRARVPVQILHLMKVCRATGSCASSVSLRRVVGPCSRAVVPITVTARPSKARGLGRIIHVSDSGGRDEREPPLPTRALSYAVQSAPDLRREPDGSLLHLLLPPLIDPPFYIAYLLLSPIGGGCAPRESPPCIS